MFSCKVWYFLNNCLAVRMSSEATLLTVREKITEKCVQLLANYRKTCASASEPGQVYYLLL